MFKFPQDEGERLNQALISHHATDTLGPWVYRTEGAASRPLNEIPYPVPERIVFAGTAFTYASHRISKIVSYAIDALCHPTLIFEVIISELRLAWYAIRQRRNARLHARSIR